MSEKLQARTRVRVVLDIWPTDVWGQDCPMAQVYKQGQESALQVLQNMIEKCPSGRFRIVGKPEVEAVISTDDR